MLALKNLKILFIALVLTLLVFLIAFFNFFQKWNLVMNDSFLYDAKNVPSSEVVIVTIDDKSLQDEALGRWQDWERTNYVELIEQLEKAGVAVIGLDLTFSEYSQKKESDLALAQILKKYDNIVVGQDAGANAIIPEFKKDNASVGIVEFPVDQDQKVRKVQLVFPGSSYEHFSIALVKKYFAITDQKSFLDTVGKRYVLTTQTMRIPGKNYKLDFIPLNAQNEAYINFFGAPDSYQSFAFVDILKGKIPEEKLKNKIVLIGENAGSLYDEKNVPVSGGKPMPGVEIHANFIQTVLEGKFLVPQTDLQIFVTIALVVFLSCYFFYLFKPWVTTILFFVVVFTIILIWAQIAPSLGRIVSIFYVVCGVLVSYITIFVYRYATVERARQKIEKAFAMYVSKDVVDEIREHPEMLHLGGEKRLMTAFFSDIQGFTTISEMLDPEVLVTLLNEYFAAMTKIVFKYKGTLDKYEGDAIVAFWNAPSRQDDHARLACDTALKMQQHLQILRLKWKKEGKPDIYVRMGINTGEMIVGNVGSEERFNYTIMGDAVNLSARLESANKHYGTYLMVSETTYEVTKDFYEFRELDLIKVKGKNKAVRVYELLAHKGHLIGKMSEILSHYKAGIEAYYQKKWDYALTHFEKVLEIDAQDVPTQIYVERCLNFKKNPPMEDWDGVYALESK